MKKMLSVLLSAMMLFAVATSFAVPALAAVDVKSPQGTVIHSLNDAVVNGKNSNKVVGKSEDNRLVFTYTGEGKVQGWNLIDKDGKTVDLKDCKACKVVEMKDNKLVIEVLDWDAFEAPDGYKVNVLVLGATAEGDKDNSDKSPSTGVAGIAFAATAAAGSALVLLKKKSDAE